MMNSGFPFAPARPSQQTTGVVRGKCEDHFFYTDTVNGYGFWESDRTRIVKAPEDGIFGSRNVCGPGAIRTAPMVPVPAGARMHGLGDTPKVGAGSALVIGIVAWLVIKHGRRS